jgi:polysaccharide export outer membrane protein
MTGAKMKLRVSLPIAALCTSFLATATPQSPAPAAPLVFGASEYRLGPEDVIEVFVWKEPDLSTTVVVRPDGKVSVPLIGELSASGKSAAQLQSEILTKLAQFIAQPAVNVLVKEVNSAQVSVLGEVKNPGMYKIRDRSTVLDAVALAGGFTEYAKRNKVTVLRTTSAGDQERIMLNVDDYIKGERPNMFYVLPYDKIYVQ